MHEDEGEIALRVPACEGWTILNENGRVGLTGHAGCVVPSPRVEDRLGMFVMNDDVGQMRRRLEKMNIMMIVFRT